MRILITGVRASGKTHFLKGQLNKHLRDGGTIGSAPVEWEEQRLQVASAKLPKRGYIQYVIAQDVRLLPDALQMPGAFDLHLVCHHDGERYWVEAVTE